LRRYAESLEFLVTGHKIWSRYQEQGSGGIYNRSRAPHRHPNQTPFEDDGNIFIAPGELTLSRPADQQIDPIMRCDSVLVDWITSIIESRFLAHLHSR